MVHYDPRLPSINSIASRHWRSIVTRDPQLQEVFPDPNLKSKLIRAKVPPAPATRRARPGMRKCGKGCPVCPYIQPGQTFKATATNYIVDMTTEMDCNTSNICYAISCGVTKCGKQYIGQTSKSLKERVKRAMWTRMWRLLGDTSTSQVIESGT